LESDSFGRLRLGLLRRVAGALALLADRATTSLTGTVFPSSARISSSVPATGLGISASTLSVEISNSGWSRSTLSPTLTSHLVIVPSAIDSPIWGITTSVAISLSHRVNQIRPSAVSTRSAGGAGPS
jgi:hypothetical protein